MMPPPIRTKILWIYSVILFLFLGASAAITPLYPLYHEQWQATLPMLQAAFAVYALTLLLALLCFGSLSDHLGRRPVVWLAIAIEISAMLQFSIAGSIAEVIRGRALQGLATGIATSALSAGLQDAHRERGGLISGMIPMGSMAALALGSALLAKFAPQPLHFVFYILTAAMIIAACLLFIVPETVSRIPGALVSLWPRVHVPHAARAAMWRIAPASVAVWALAGLLLSLGPTIARIANHDSGGALLGGSVVAVVMTSALVAMVAHLTGSGVSLLRRGAVAVLAGLPLVLISLHVVSSPVFLLGASIAGAGLGLTVQGSLRIIVPLAESHERAGLAAGYFVMSYLAFSAPAFAAGFAVNVIGLRETTDIYVVILLILTTLTLRSLNQHGTATVRPARSH
ncbi:multidrug resistance protein [Acetobacter nitrogenifigens DSM 23921 = NBRC 105050]|nr:MFS transporter [Acetobacter nitrogenifigens]GBQ94286.1 multidrug resistance protein [Acetobacter nitrogenifigens DSM 23921 = NBRC 105050]